MKSLMLLCLLLITSHFCFSQNETANLYLTPKTDSLVNPNSKIDQININKIDINYFNTVLFDACNQVRINNNLATFSYDSILNVVTSNYSCDMVTLDFFDHFHPNRKFKTLKKRLKVNSYKYNFAGENLADINILKLDEEYGYIKKNENGELINFDGTPITVHSHQSAAKSVIDFWLNSPAHRANLLHPNYSNMAIGSYLYWDEVIPRVRITQNFSKPAE